MSHRPAYLDTAHLLVEIAPVIFENEAFALKGGTAINLFLREVPRLSVDLDVVFTDHLAPRSDALGAISKGLQESRGQLESRGFKVHAVTVADIGVAKLLVQRGDVSVKVEVNTVLRGTVYPTQTMALTDAASHLLKTELELPLLSPEDIYGGKLVAALDRQHPRDLFDIMELFAHGGITPGIRRAFVVYLASHNRTIHEVLFAEPKDISHAYAGEFAGLATALAPMEKLIEARDRLFRELPAALVEAEREFLRGFVRAEPDWALLGLPHLAQLPAIRWRLQNLQKLAKASPERFRDLARALDEAFSKI
jgi:predicted nucleotidyltransferase component of viral defense system